MTPEPPSSQPPDPPPERGFDAPARLTYGSYLKVSDLLGLQTLQSQPAHHDELQFIIVHQAYELWFKLVLFELESARGHLLAGRTDEALPPLARVREVERVLLQQVHVLETMSPQAFLGFRDHLRPASGFQSAQFREVEILSGLREPSFLKLLQRENHPDLNEALARRMEQPSLREAMHAMLQARGLDVGHDPVTRGWDDAKLDARVLEIYRSGQPADVLRVLEALVDHDESIVLWRHHHAVMVERLIGDKQGTGGSSGAAYLRATTSYRFFPELWRVRGELGGAY